MTDAGNMVVAVATYAWVALAVESGSEVRR